MPAEIEVRIVDDDAFADVTRPAEPRRVRHVIERHLDQRLHLARREDEVGPPIGNGDERPQQVVADDDPERRERADDANLVRLNVYTTDVDQLFPHYGVLASRLAAAGVAPVTTMLGVTRLAIPGQLVELEATAVA